MAARKKAKAGARRGTKPGSAHVAETTSRPYRAVQPETRISASEFKARCLELMDNVRDTHETIIITKHGKPVAKLVPFEDQFPSAVGYMRGTVLSYGDLISPIDVEWDASK